jgi:ubiquinone/menaquinone biosynthesis C-methylase UbiE
MPRSAAESRTLFDNWAASYDASVRRPGGPLEGYEGSLAEAAAMLPVAAGTRVLDIGIGTGGFSGLLAERGARVAGVDISAQMLEQCRAAHPDFELSPGSFLPIPHPDGGFDAVVASFAFHEVAPSDRPAACREMARVLKPGGWVCLLDVIFASAAAEAESARIHGRFWDPTEDYPRVGDLDEALRGAGFTGLYWRQTGPMHWAVLGRREGE